MYKVSLTRCLRAPQFPRVARPTLLRGIATSLKQQVQNDMKEALKAKDKLRVTTLKGLSSDFLNAEKDVPAKQPKGESDYFDLVRKSISRRLDSEAQYTAAGRNDLAEKELMEMDILKKYLPAQLSPQDLEGKIGAFITELNVENLKGIGAIMKAAQGLIDQGLASKKDISDVVKKLLK
jgi:uncharacterized protein YqeY